MYGKLFILAALSALVEGVIFPVRKDNQLAAQPYLGLKLTEIQQADHPILFPYGSLFDNATASSLPGKVSGGNGCYCLNDTCACCEHLDIPKLHINNTGCVELVYLPEELGISLLFIIDNIAWINRTVSVHNPPPICYAVPKVSMANLCLQFYNLDVKDKLLTGCVRVVAELADIEIYKRNVGCFKFPIFFRPLPPSIPRYDIDQL